MRVSRCSCYDVSFAELKGMLDREPGLTVQDLMQRTGCGGDCGMCVPYIRLMMETGETKLPVLTYEQFERLMAT